MNNLTFFVDGLLPLRERSGSIRAIDPDDHRYEVGIEILLVVHPGAALA